MMRTEGTNSRPITRPMNGSDTSVIGIAAGLQPSPQAMQPESSDNRLDALYRTTLDLLRLDRHELTTLQLSGLLSVYVNAQTQSLGDLAKLLGVSRPMATRIIDRLEQERLVRRRADREDRRRVLICRTSEGHAYAQMLAGVMPKG